MMKNINIAEITKESIVDGEGYRYTIFVQGCAHKCPGCHNQYTWDFSGGKVYTPEMLEEVIKEILEDPIIDGITLSGGDPFYQPEACTEFIKELKKRNKDLTIWVYTGFTWEEVIQNRERLELVKQCDVLIDGPFLEYKKSLELKFRGQGNQRVIDIKRSLESNDIVLYIN